MDVIKPNAIDGLMYRKNGIWREIDISEYPKNTTSVVARISYDDVVRITYEAVASHAPVAD